MNEVLNQDAKDHGLENDAYFKNFDEGQMLQLDERFMQGAMPNDDISSLSGSSKRYR